MDKDRKEMVFPMALLQIAVLWLLSCYKAVSKLIRSYVLIHRNQSSKPNQTPSLLCLNVAKRPLEGQEVQTLVCEFHGALLRSSSPFPFFMLVAFEGGSLFRALFLLLSCPLLWAMGHNSELGFRVMVFITFCGLKVKKMELVARAVLPKFYLEDLHLHAYEALASAKRRVVLSTTMPRVMVEWFLKEYLSVAEVLATELQVFGGGCYFTGLITISPIASNHLVLKDLFGEAKADVGLVNSSTQHHHHILVSHCKEVYMVNKDSGASTMPRDRYPKPLVFHDGRLAFLPTPVASLSLFLWLPLGVPLAVMRVLLGVLLPYELAIILGSFTGVRLRVRGLSNCTAGARGYGVLYVCTHRTLLDPVMLSTALRRPVPAVTYSLSLTSELLAPMRTVRLTRDRARDAETMRRLLADGDLAVCPEGTTCREPYLLRFSSLFAQLAAEMVPVAVDARVGMFYGTTASGLKWLDPLFFLMNPTPAYRLEFLGHVTAAAGRSGAEVANGIQRLLAEALGFECTALTRRDKYLMLAGNEGVVSSR